jgi:glucosamine kinase
LGIRVQVTGSGVEAMRALLHALDLGRATPLLDAILQHWGLASLADLVATANQRPAPDFAALVPVVGRKADAGDPVAKAVLEEAGGELARQVMVVAERMGAEVDTELAIAYTGSVLEHLGRVRQAMQDCIWGKFPRVRFLEEPSFRLKVRCGERGHSPCRRRQSQEEIASQGMVD